MQFTMKNWLFPCLTWLYLLGESCYMEPFLKQYFAFLEYLTYLILNDCLMLHFSEMRNGMTPTDIQTPYSDTCIFPKCFSWQKVFIIFSSPILSGLHIHTLDPFSVNLTLKPPITTAADSGWLGMAKVSCILFHRDVQLILACSWARPAILIADKDRGAGGMFLFLLFLHFQPCSSFIPVPLFHLYFCLFHLNFSFSLEDDTKWPTRVDMSLNPNTINQSTTYFYFSERIKSWHFVWIIFQANDSHEMPKLIFSKK